MEDDWIEIKGFATSKEFHTYRSSKLDLEKDVSSDSVYYYDKDCRLHNPFGPASHVYSTDTKEWFIHGYYINCNTQEEFERYMRLKAFW